MLMFVFVCFNVPATTEIYTDLHTLSLHVALPILCGPGRRMRPRRPARIRRTGKARMHPDRKSVRKVRADRQGVNMHRKPCPALQANDDALFTGDEMRGLDRAAIVDRKSVV